MARIRIGRAAQVPPGEVREFRSGERIFAVCNVAGELHALEGTCPHEQGPLGHGNLEGSALICPWHAWEFDSRTGELDLNPSVCLRTYPLMVENGDLFVEVE